jgi:hypothetical protein
VSGLHAAAFHEERVHDLNVVALEADERPWLVHHPRCTDGYGDRAVGLPAGLDADQWLELHRNVSQSLETRLMDDLREKIGVGRRRRGAVHLRRIAQSTALVRE